MHTTNHRGTPQAAVRRLPVPGRGRYLQALIQIKETRTAALASPRLAALTRYADDGTGP